MCMDNKTPNVEQNFITVAILVQNKPGYTVFSLKSHLVLSGNSPDEWLGKVIHSFFLLCVLPRTQVKYPPFTQQKICREVFSHLTLWSTSGRDSAMSWTPGVFRIWDTRTLNLLRHRLITTGFSSFLLSVQFRHYKGQTLKTLFTERKISQHFPTPHLEGPSFHSRPWDWLSWLTLAVGFLILMR